MGKQFKKTSREISQEKINISNLSFVKYSSNGDYYFIDSNVSFPTENICIDKPLIIQLSAVVSIDGGTNFFFSESSRLINYGRFKAKGETNKRISFQPMNEYWLGLIFATQMATGSFLHNCDIFGGIGSENKFLNHPTHKYQTLSLGGGLKVSEADIELKGCNIFDCSSELGGAAYFFNSKSRIISTNIYDTSGVYGGGLYADNSSLNISNLSVTNCRAEYGGAIALLNDESMFDLICNLMDNRAIKGAGVFIDNSCSHFDGINVRNNNSFSPDAEKYKLSEGGGFWVRNSNIRSDLSTILENQAKIGKNIYIENSQVLWTGKQPPNRSIFFRNGQLIPLS